MAEVFRQLSDEHLALVGPFEGSGRAIVMVDEGQDASGEVIDRGEGAALEELAGEDGEPDLDLVEPGAVVGGVVEDDAVGRIGQEGGTALARGQDAGLALDPEVAIAQARQLGDPADQRRRAVGVEVVGDDVPAGGGRVGGDDGLQIGQEVGLGAGRPGVRGEQPAGGDVAAEDERAGAVADVLELAPLDLARGERQAGVLALERLDAGQLVGADAPLAALGEGGRIAIEGADIGDFGVELGIGRRRGQPVADQVRSEIPLFNRRAAWRGEIVSTMPRRTISAANSVVLHWLIGRPDALGASQASATIRATCSGVIRAGVPERGASASRAATLRSASAAPPKLSQRRRQRRAVSGSSVNCRAISLLFRPSAASSTIRARSASCCPVLWRRTKPSNSPRSSAVRSTDGGLGPGIASSTPSRGTRFSHYRPFSAKVY